MGGSGGTLSDEDTLDNELIKGMLSAQEKSDFADKFVTFLDRCWLTVNFESQSNTQFYYLIYLHNKLYLILIVLITIIKYLVSGLKSTRLQKG
jgi:uncharacterized membrane protein YkvA (DUF1232 family)